MAHIPEPEHPPDGRFAPQADGDELTVTFDETVQALLEPADIPVLGLDRSGRCLFANLAGSALLGFGAGDVVGRDLSAMLQQEAAEGIDPFSATRSFATPVLVRSRDGVRRTVAVATAVRKAGRPHGVLLSFIGAGGTWLPLGGYGAPSAFLGRLLDSINEYVVVQAPDGTCQYANERVTEICGIPRDHLIGKDLVGVFGLDGRAHNILLDAMLGRKSAVGECVLARADGGERIVTFDYGPLTVAGRTVAMVAVGEDVTERRKAEAHLQELQAESERVDTLLAAARSVAIEILSSTGGQEALRDIANAVCKLAHADGAAIVFPAANPGQAPTIVTATADAGPRWKALVLELARSRGTDWPPLEEVGDKRLASFQVVRQGDAIATVVAARPTEAEPFSAADISAVESITGHVAVAIHHAGLMARQRELLQSQIEAGENERLVVSRDLHDGLAQYVMALHAYLQSAQHDVEQGDLEAAKRHLSDATKTAATTAQEVRRFVGGLRLLTLEDLGLAGAIEQLVEEERRRAGWEAAEFLDETDGLEGLSRTVETMAYRIAQEALCNVRKHAKAKHVQLRLRLLSDRQAFEIVVTDDGCGFIPSARGSSAQHLGIHGMHERALLVRGRLHLHSAPGHGTTVQATFPRVSGEDDKH